MKILLIAGLFLLPLGAFAQSVDFDGAVKPDAAPVPDAPRPQKAKPGLEKTIFKATTWGYHAAWAADFASTGIVLDKGGYETDHLYTQFGRRNMAGVIGSAAAVHAGVSLAAYELQKRAEKTHGLKRGLLEAGAIGIEAYGIGAHVQGAAHNAGVLERWNKR